MNFSSLPFIAFKMIRGKGTSKKGREMSQPAVRIAVAGIAIGMAVIIIALAVVIGFKREVIKQISGFGSHIQIAQNYTFSANSTEPIVISQSTQDQLLALDQISAVQRVVVSSAILKNNEEFQGVLLKGVDSTYNWNFFSKNIVAGQTLENMEDSLFNGAMISEAIASRMSLELGDDFIVYFFKQTLRSRKFKIVGIYQTTFSAYDELYILTDARVLQRIEGWDEQQFSQVELLVNDFDKVEDVSRQVFDILLVNEPNVRSLSVKNIKEISPEIFSWLEMLNMNGLVILILMILVSGFCIISGLLILILERRATIGLFKSLGATNFTIRNIFTLQGGYLLCKGLIIGNIVGLLIVGIQYFTHLIPLAPKDYYVDHVPVWINFPTWFLLNVGILAVGFLILLLPTIIISHISPSEAIKQD